MNENQEVSGRLPDHTGGPIFNAVDHFPKNTDMSGERKLELYSALFRIVEELKGLKVYEMEFMYEHFKNHWAKQLTFPKDIPYQISLY